MIIVCLSGCSSKKSNEKDLVDVELVETPSTIEELLEQSPVVVEAKILEDPEMFNYKDEEYYLSKIKITELMRDTNNVLSENVEILLFQNDFKDIDPLVNKGDNLLLCLKKINVPGYENVYRTIGLYKFKIKEDNKISLLDGDNESTSKEYINNDFEEDKAISLNSNEFSDLINKPELFIIIVQRCFAPHSSCIFI